MIYFRGLGYRGVFDVAVTVVYVIVSQSLLSTHCVSSHLLCPPSETHQDHQLHVIHTCYALLRLRVPHDTCCIRVFGILSKCLLLLLSHASEFSTHCPICYKGWMLTQQTFSNNRHCACRRISMRTPPIGSLLPPSSK